MNSVPTSVVENIGATHAVCPLCGKSSSLRSFPSGPGTDIPLQAFRGKGRGRGFAVIRKGSGLEREELRRSVLEKVEAIVAAFAQRGFPVELHWSRGGDPEAKGSPTWEEEAPTPADEPKDNVAAELEMEQRTGQFLEDELAHMEGELARERRLREEALLVVVSLRKRLDELTGLGGRMMESARACVGSLMELHQTKDQRPTRKSISKMASRLEGMVVQIQELRHLSAVNSLAQGVPERTR